MQLIRDFVAPFGTPRPYYFNSCRFSKPKQLGAIRPDHQGIGGQIAMPSHRDPRGGITVEKVNLPPNKRDKVMLLHDMSCAVPNFDGGRTVYREKLFSAYSLVDLATIPNRIVESLVEGQDYLSSWDEADRRLKEHERQNSVEEFSMENPLPDDLHDRKNVHFPYEPL
jgi:hypothetical protein